MMPQIGKAVRQLGWLWPLVLVACAKNDVEREPVLARVGERTITQKEFLYRVEFMPPPVFESVNGQTGKAGLLELLVAEKLIAAAAEEAGMDSARFLREQLELVQQYAVLRELYKDEVQSKISLSEAEVATALKQSQTRFVIDYFQSRSKPRAQRERQRWQSQLSRPPDADRGDDVRGVEQDVSWGDMEPALEQWLYRLQEGEISPLIRFSQGYAFFHVRKVYHQPLVTQSEIAQRMRRIRKVMRFRKIDSLSARFVAHFMNAKKLVLKHDTFNALAAWLDLMLQYKDEPDIGPGAPPNREVILDSMKTALGRYLDRPLITYDGGEFSLRDMIRALRIRNMPFEIASPRAMRKQLMADLKLIARDKLLAREALRRGLDRRPEVQFDVRLWRDYYLSRLYADRHQLRLFPETSGGPRRRVVFPEPLQRLRDEADVWINQPLLEKLDITGLPMMAVRPGRIVTLVAPPWPN